MSWVTNPDKTTSVTTGDAEKKSGTNLMGPKVTLDSATPDAIKRRLDRMSQVK